MLLPYRLLERSCYIECQRPDLLASQLRSTPAALQEALPLDWRLDPRAFQASLSVLQADGKIHWSLTPAATTYLQSSLHCKVDSASSAIFKLEEALRIAAIPLADLGIAIDLGEAFLVDLGFGA